MQADLPDMNDKEVIVVYFTNVPENTCPYVRINNENIKDIKYHTPRGEGDRHFVDVYYNDGRSYRYFNIESVGFNTIE